MDRMLRNANFSNECPQFRPVFSAECPNKFRRWAQLMVLISRGCHLVVLVYVHQKPANLCGCSCDFYLSTKTSRCLQTPRSAPEKGVFWKRGLFRKKTPFSRDSREFRDSRDSREPLGCGKQRRIRPFF